MKNLENQAIPVLRVEHNFKSIERLYLVIMILALVVFALCFGDVLLTMADAHAESPSQSSITTLDNTRA